MTVVIDAGVVVALIVADERQDAARAHLESWLDADEALHAPAVLPYEIANVLARLVFDGAVEISEVDDIWEDLVALGLILHPFDLAKDGPDVAAITAQLHRRHATDSSYIGLARRPPGSGGDEVHLAGERLPAHPAPRNAGDEAQQLRAIHCRVSPVR